MAHNTYDFDTMMYAVQLSAIEHLSKGLNNNNPVTVQVGGGEMLHLPRFKCDLHCP